MNKRFWPEFLVVYVVLGAAFLLAVRYQYLDLQTATFWIAVAILADVLVRKGK